MCRHAGPGAAFEALRVPVAVSQPARRSGPLGEALEDDRGRGERRAVPGRPPRSGTPAAGRDVHRSASRSRPRPPCPAARSRPHREPDLRATEFPGPPGEAQQIARLAPSSSALGVVRAFVSSSPSSARRVGACGRARRPAMTSSNRTHGTSPNSAATLPPSRSRRSASVQPSVAETRTDGLAPGRLAGGPDVPSDRWPARSPRRRDERRRPTSVLADRRDADVDRLDPGIGRDDRVRRAQEVSPSSSATCDSPIPVEPVRPRGDVRTEPERPQARQRLVRPHRPHLARRTGQGDDDPAVRPRRRTSRARSRSGWRGRSPTGSARPA